ncbi:MAG: putative nucleotidyltransferase substrate binding domain-containing protein, partial [Desulfobulbales bacterium]|nr:putative nucleotidyltransferase substrate binding domain-containing protein [Desulfobulbales bacterium]
YYPKGRQILTQDGPPSEFLGVIKKGGVKVFQTSEGSEEVVVDLRGEGEHFGMLSLISGDRSRNNVVTLEDTICYQVPRKTVLGVLQKNPEVNEYFIKSFFVNLLDKTYEETRKAYTGGTTGEQVLFSTKVKDIVRTEPITISPDTTIQQAAAEMATHKISSLVVVGPGGVPLGIVTDRDFREKVVAEARDVANPIKDIMNTPLITIDSEENCFEAVLRMIRHRIHHILVLEGEKLGGMLTNHDFMLFQGSSPTILVKEIGQIKTIAELQDTAPKFYKAVSSLLRHGARPHNITGLITELIEKITNTVIEIFAQENGPPPVAYTLFFFGAGGRHELTLSFHVKMGVVYQDVSPPGQQQEVDSYFKLLAETLNSSMMACKLTGKGACLRAENIQGFSGWQERFNRWGTGAGTGRDAGFIDMRAIRGEHERVNSLRQNLINRARHSKGLMEAVAANTLQIKPPLGFFKYFVVEKSGEHKNELNLYEKGIKPLVGCARIYGLEKGVLRRSTMGRLHELNSRHGFKIAEDMTQAFGYLNVLLIHNQLRQAEEGLAPDNFINPDILSNFERKTLKESFQLTARLYEDIEGNYWSGKVLP